MRSNGELYTFYSFRVRGDYDKKTMENLFKNMLSMGRCEPQWNTRRERG